MSVKGTWLPPGLPYLIHNDINEMCFTIFTINQLNFAEEESITHQKLAEKLGITMATEFTNKKGLLETWRKDLGLEWSQVAFMGKSRIR